MVEWRGIEIHPETPPGGRPLTELFREEDIQSMNGHLRAAGAPFGITFIDRPFLSNSHSALLAAEFSREQGKFDMFHPVIFSAYFSHGLDIGNLDILSQLGEDAGLDAKALRNAVLKGTHLPRLDAAKEDASRIGVTGVPTFLVNKKVTIVGAQPLDVFRKTLKTP